LLSRIVPQSGWGDTFPSDEMSLAEDTIPLAQDKKKRKEAYILYKEGHVTTVQTTKKGKLWWFKAVVEATQKTKQGERIFPYNLFLAYMHRHYRVINFLCIGYTVFAAIKVVPNKSSEKVWGHCNCPAGVEGLCKHSFALIFQILNFERMGLDKLEMDHDIPTPTGKFHFLLLINILLERP
jgi:hypothetical protein